MAAELSVHPRGGRAELLAKTAIVTGGAAGIGSAIARAMAEAGARVVIADVDDESGKRLANEIGAVYSHTDVSDTSQIASTVASTVQEFGSLDILVNNAGITRHVDLLDVTEDYWDRIHAVNSRGLFFFLQAAAAEMKKQGGGAIVNISSISALGYKLTSSVAYASSKGSVISITRTAAIQLAKYNIRVNAICPGVTLTSILDDWRASSQAAEATYQRMLGEIPLGRPILPEHIAALAVFLASPGAETLTAQTISVDGGLIPD
jgi:NAD(P)-dependent dehydrogenase (short-subunit alcohol dehydrogenase family)